MLGHSVRCALASCTAFSQMRAALLRQVFRDTIVSIIHLCKEWTAWVAALLFTVSLGTLPAGVGLVMKPSAAGCTGQVEEECPGVGE